MAKRKGLIVFLVIVLIIAAAVFITVQFVNNKIEEIVTEEINSVIADNDLFEMISYDEIVIEIGKGKITLKDARFRNPEIGAAFSGEELYISIPPSEAVRFLRAQGNASLNSIKFGGSEFDFNVAGGSGNIGDFDLSAEGDVLSFLNNFQRVTSSGLDLSGVVLTGKLKEVNLDENVRTMIQPFLNETGTVLPDSVFSADLKPASGPFPMFEIK